MNKQTRKEIFKLLDRETAGLNMKMKNAKNQLIFSYNDVADFLEVYGKKLESQKQTIVKENLK